MDAVGMVAYLTIVTQRGDGSRRLAMNCKEHAQKCLLMANEARSPEQKAAWINLADRWRAIGDPGLDDFLMYLFGVTVDTTGSGR
jgi:hypothetical protein